MSSNVTFSTYQGGKQAEIIHILNELFKGNERFHGAGNIEGAKFDEEKNKWKPGHTRFVHTKLTDTDWHAHLMGERFIGACPLLDDGTVWFACIDVDKTEDSLDYQFNYAEEMGKIKRSGLPLVVFRTKSGGLRVALFFSEPIEAEYTVRRMKQIAAQLGYAGQEIFPKSVKMDVASGDCSGWIFLPFGPSGNEMFPDQCCMHESGNAMELYESVQYAMSKRISKDQFAGLFVTEITAKANGRANGKKHPKGQWVQPADNEPYIETIKTMFWDGPICLWNIAMERCTDLRHNFLFVCAIFLKRKYPENWDKALEWLNFNAVRPAGDTEKLQELVRDIKKRGDRPYEYPCKTAPICNRCHAHACKKQAFGVGAGNGVDYHDLGITIINAEPQVFFVSIGDARIKCTADELLNLNKFRVKCLEKTASFPDRMPTKEWDRIVAGSIENASRVDPVHVVRTDAFELELLESYLSIHIMSGVRRNYGEFMEGKWGEYVRVIEDEKTIYFKEKSLLWSVGKQRGSREVELMRQFVANKCIEHQQGPGIRGWFRRTYSVAFDQFDPDTLQRWFDSDKEEDDG